MSPSKTHVLSEIWGNHEFKGFVSVTQAVKLPALCLTAFLNKLFKPILSRLFYSLASGRHVTALFSAPLTPLPNQHFTDINYIRSPTKYTKFF